MHPNVVRVAEAAGSYGLRVEAQEFPDGTRTADDADAVRAATGFSIGGVPPFGHDTPLATAIDEDLLTFQVVWAAAGTPTHVFPIAPGDLVQVSGGVVAPLRAG